MASGIHPLLIEALDKDGAVVANQTMYVSLEEPPGVASIPETNWIGTVLVLGCVLLLAFGFETKKQITKRSPDSI
jgi:hypothetical protein